VPWVPTAGSIGPAPSHHRPYSSGGVTLSNAMPGEAGDARVDSFLTQLLATSPGLRFGAIVRAAQIECRVSRATAARRLARLVRFGELVLLPDHTYAPAGSGGDRSRAVVELRWVEQLVTVLPSGAGRVFQHREFRVVSGTLDFFDFAFNRRPQQFSWWLSARGRLNRSARAAAGTPMFSYRIDLESPLTSRKAEWQHLLISGELRDWFRMAKGAPAFPGASGIPDDPAKEFLCSVLPLHGRVYDHRLSPDAFLRLQVTLPERYPVHSPRLRVVWQTDPGRSDRTELVRLQAAARGEDRQDGLRATSTTFTLSVPQPRLDRRYCIEWTLPTAARRRSWLAGQGASGR
jgi:hypothetical protein